MLRSRDFCLRPEINNRDVVSSLRRVLSMMMLMTHELMTHDAITSRIGLGRKCMCPDRETFVSDLLPTSLFAGNSHFVPLHPSPPLSKAEVPYIGLCERRAFSSLCREHENEKEGAFFLASQRGSRYYPSSLPYFVAIKRIP